MSELELLQAAQTGSRDAQDELMRLSQPALSAFLAAKIGARVARTMPAADVEQETFLRTLEALPKLDPLPSLEAFQALLKRRALWIIYRASESNEFFAGESAVSAPLADRVIQDTGLSRDGGVTRADEARWLEAQVDRLSEKPAEVMRARLMGSEFARIADELGLAEDTVRKRYLRALTELQQIMRPQE